MKQAKRLFYMVLLNIIISLVTVGVVLKLYERAHPAISAKTTPVVIVVTVTPGEIMPVSANPTGLDVTTPVNLSTLGAAQATPTLGMLSYRVKEGDTLGALAAQFNLSVDDIMAVNDLTDPNTLILGQVLRIPTGPLPTATFTATPTSLVASATPRPSATPTSTSKYTATPTVNVQEAQVMIETVINPGNLENEHVVLLRTGYGELSLMGWRLTDEKGKQYTFPQLTLYKDGAINLYTRAGQNTVVDLYWGLASPIWSSGKTINLYDALNKLRATYTVP